MRRPVATARARPTNGRDVVVQEPLARMGRQDRTAAGDDDLVGDILFSHDRIHYVVAVESKGGKFSTALVRPLNLYLSAVDDLLKAPPDNPTIGLLLCRSKKKFIGDNALRGLKRPIGVAQWTTELVDELPDDLRGSLPTVEEIEAELSADDT